MSLSLFLNGCHTENTGLKTIGNSTQEKFHLAILKWYLGYGVNKVFLESAVYLDVFPGPLN